MTKYVVRCVFGGTSLTFPAAGRTPQKAVAKIETKRAAKDASVFLVFERKTGNVVHTQLNAR